MAYWGEAMTYNHTVWMEQDTAAARAVLARLAPTRAERLVLAPTDRERAYLDAVETLYGEGSKYERDFAYSDAMRVLHHDFPNDIDARAFYALSILGLAHEGRDFRLYMRSAALLEEVFPQNQEHPGVLHYMIHSYDDPTHAPLGLRAARRYGQVAPNAGHALHMTSHIFVALAMWDDVVSANIQAERVVREQRAEQGLSINNCGHYSEWLVYGYLQQGEVELADASIAACRLTAEEELRNNPVETAEETYRSTVFSHTDVAVRRLVDTGAWSVPEPLAIPAGRYLRSRWLTSYGNALAARGNMDQLAGLVSEMEALVGAFVEARAGFENPPSTTHQEIMLLQVRGLLALASDDPDSGIEKLRTAAQMESDMPVEFGPPAVPMPSYELLGDELRRLDQTDEARNAYQVALELTPGRTRVVAALAEMEPATD
jgi:tetratricopeptide (TPR) repeat protein